MVIFLHPLPSQLNRGALRLRASVVVFCLTVFFAVAGCSAHRQAVTARSETAERLSEEARQARDRGNSREAQSLLEAAVDRNPTDYEMRLELSEVLMANGSSAAAASHLAKVINQIPEDPRGYIGMAEAMYDQQNLSEADNLLEKALELDPRQTRGLVLRGKVELARRHDERALENFYQVLAFDPDHIEAKMQIAELHFQHGDIKFAAPLLRSIIENSEPGNAEQAPAQWLLGQCYARDERWSDAARSLGAGIASRRASALDWYQLADASWRAGDRRSAESAVGHALRLSPADPKALALRQVLNHQPRVAASSGDPVVTRLSHAEAEPAVQPTEAFRPQGGQ